MYIATVGRAFPPHYADQDTLIAAFRAAWAERYHNVARIEQLHRNVLVGGRHLALPMADYLGLRGFTEANDAFVRVGTDVGAAAVTDALTRAGLTPQDVDAIWFVSVTGMSAPSIDARLVNRLGFRPDIKRTPIFGLGCVAGAAGVARVSDYLRGFPDHVAILLSVELCSLTLQKEDLSIPNLIASGLFGDGAACVVLVGEQRAKAMGLAGSDRPAAPHVVVTRSVFYPDTESVMGWNIGSDGFKIVLSAEVPDMVTRHLRGDVDRFLADAGLDYADIATWIAHPGGPKVLEAMESVFPLPPGALARTWTSLREVGNLSSASVLMVLRETLAEPPPPGSYGLLIAMGPGFCSELVLLRW
ncbi:MAG: 3-oxoacyl-[acyl-carrier-protein] synthase III C-terminal domain-containing protein [Pseudomonadota bacterium]|nr:3-oxoacyl-[acyl-carrier-protein] synthase III C-terminal domain-containing protein [Pseudomonadota bacterium]